MEDKINVKDITIEAERLNINDHPGLGLINRDKHIKVKGPNSEAAYNRMIELRRIEKRLERILNDSDTSNISNNLVDMYERIFINLDSAILMESKNVATGEIFDD